MSKNTRMTHITPLPASVTREAAVSYLHNHRQMIELNPLVLRHQRTTAPPNAAPDEAESMTWYEITDEIQYIPGTPIKGQVSYKAGFYDVANGLQTHTFAPGGVDIRGKWTVGGNEPGEEKEPVEIGTNKPRDGLYIQEEVDLKCNVFFTNFVKKNLKKSHSTVVDSIVDMAVGMAAEGKAQNQNSRPEHTRTNSENSSTKNSRRKRPSDAGNLTSTPTSYTQTGSNHCSCPMGAFGVHMESCHGEPQSPQSQSQSQPQAQSPPQSESQSQTESRPGPETSRSSVKDYTAELDGNPIAAQHYYQYAGGRAAELEGE